tara:strand:- start:726 stop:3380 length:2655 start_codon:yes stop_codon:yes gene_type:complete
MLRKFVFNAGIVKEGTRYSAENSWYDGSNVRFRKGFPEKIGGWERLSSNTYLGACRSLHNWSSYNGDDYMGVGTSQKVYVELGGRYYDITPFRYKSLARLYSAVVARDTANFAVPKGTGAALVGDYLRIGSEYVLVDSLGSEPDDNDVVAVTRARAGTEASTYSAGVAYFQIEKAVSNPIGIVNGTSEVVFKQTDHGALVGDMFTFLSISANFTANGITRADLLNGYSTATSTQGFKITRVMSPDYFEFDVPGESGTNENTTLTTSLSTSDTTVVLASGTFQPADIIKIGSEYIELGAETPTNTFGSSKRGQLGSLPASHPSNSLVSKVSFLGANVFALYDMSAEKTTLTVGSGFGAGRWSGYTELGTTTTTLANGETAGATTIRLTSATGFATPAGTILIGTELISYTSVSTNDLGSATRGDDSTVAIPHSSGSIVYSVDSDWTSWGAGSASATETRGIRLWSLDNDSDDLLLAPRDGEPCIWVRSDKVSGSIPSFIESTDADVNGGASNSQAVPLASLGVPGTTGFGSVPPRVREMFTYPDYQTTVAFGCSELFPDGDGNFLFNPMLVRWSSHSAFGHWLPTTDGGSSGGDVLSTGSYIAGAHRAKREILVWTDEATYLMKFIVPGDSGGSFIFTEVATGVSIIGTNAAASGGDRTFWMGDRNFYVYDGGVSILPCSVLDFIYGDLKYVDREKVFAARNSEFSEVIWFYPSNSGSDNDKYVSYNYEDGNWSTGMVPRTAWSDSGIREHPIAAYKLDSDSSLNYVQEIGSTGDSNAVEAHIRSGLFDIEDGDHVAYVSKIVPDIEWLDGGTDVSPLVIDVYSRRYTQGEDDTPVQSVTVTSSSLDPSTRIRGRQMSLKFSSNTNDSRWRIGSTLMDIKPDGRR